jgi:hypothetical protein
VTFEETRAVVSKVRKLQQLAAHNPNPHESVLAAAKADELMDRYQLRRCWSTWEQTEQDIAALTGAIANMQWARRMAPEKAAFTDAITQLQAARRRLRKKHW